MRQIDYIVCSSERSGTHLLLTYLNRLMGTPLITYNRKDIKRTEVEFNNTSPDAKRVGLLLYNNAVATFVKWIHSSEEKGQAIQETRYIFLKRENKIRQAISLMKYIQTGAHEFRKPEQRLPTYDQEMLENLCVMLCHIDAAWYAYFQKNGINPHIVMYESLDVLPYQTLADIAVFLGISPVSEESYNAFCLGNLKRQSNASSEEYLQRWQTEHLSEGFIELIS